MTITFGYFQYLSEQIILTTLIPMAITACFYIIINLFILRSSKTAIEEKERPELLYYVAVINIIFLIVPFFVPIYSISSPTEFELLLELLYVISYGITLSLPSLITYGIFIFKYGSLNEKRFNIYLKMSGILWIIYFSINLITLDGILFSILFRFLPASIVTNLFAIMGIIGYLFPVCWVFVIIHAVINKDNNLLIAGIIALIAFGVNYIYYIFLPMFMSVV